MEKTYPVYTLKNECNDCYKCIRDCHVKAIRIQGGSASVINEKCIACGHCVTICPVGAKKVRNDIEKVKALLLTGKKVYASLAPSWAGVYNFSKEKMIAALKKLGFAGVSETALGAQEVSIQTTKMLNEGNCGLYISSACPVIDDYIRMYKPKFSQYITPIASPALTHAGLLKDVFGEDVKVVFIGPCIAKKNEADRHPDLLSVALTFDELNYWLKEEFIDVDKIEVDEECKFVPENAYEGALYPLEGGMIDTIKRVGIEKDDVTFIGISSLESFEKALNGIKPDKVTNKIFVEALGCSGGCINGPCLSSDKSRILITSDIYANTNYREDVPKEPKKVISEKYVPAPIEKVEYSIEQITKALKKISKHKPEDELNCAGCGYSSCREFVNALIAGDAETSMCVSYMRKIAVRKAAAMLRCMPSATVMVDSDMNILEANDAFMKMFTGDMYEVFKARPDGLTGAAIERIVDFSDIFKTILNSGKDLHKERYPVKNRLYDISAFTIEENEIVGAVITDVTQSETNREKISQKAHEVISKNISIVQEIACLLGEHMVETETLLSSIANDYDDKDDEEG